MAELNLINETFDDQSVATPFDIYDPLGAVYSSTVRRGDSGYSRAFIQIGSNDTVGQLSGLAGYLSDGLYFRYYVFYPSTYLFPGDESFFDNVKMFKIAGAIGWDVEFIYKSTAGGPTRLQLYWNDNAGGVGGTGTGSVLLPTQMQKGVWHKIEIYIRVPETTGSASCVHVHIDDEHVYENLDADIRVPGTEYHSSVQFISIRALQDASVGAQTFYVDDVYVSQSDVDLVGSGAGETQNPVSLALDGRRHYWRIKYRDASGNESTWSSGADYFDTAITASGGVTLGPIAATGGSVGRVRTASGGVTLGRIEALGQARNRTARAQGGVTLGVIAATGGSAQRVVTESGGATLGVVAVAGQVQRTVLARGGVSLGPVRVSGEVLQNNATPLRMPGAKYYYRMRYRDALGVESSWSNGEDYFITGDVRGTIDLGAVTVAGAITVTRNASGNVPLGAAAVSGDADRILTASGGVTLGVQTVDGSSTRIITASGNITTPRHRVSSGSVMRTITARGNVPLGAVSVSGANVPTRLASGNISLGAIAVAGKMGHHAAGGVVLGPIAVAGNAPGVTAIIHVTTRIVRRHTVTTRIARRHTVVTRLEGDRS
jgi:hypothetical protein